jgi:hypothetical protein
MQMKYAMSFLIIAVLTLTTGAPAAIALEPDPLIPTDGTVTGVVHHTAEVTFDENGARTEDGERGWLEETARRLVFSSALDQRVTWNMRSALQYIDHGNWEEVQGVSNNWTDSEVHMLSVLGELFRNGNRLWNNTVPSYNTTKVSSGYSPWYAGYNAFWQSKGTHWMKVTPESPTESGNTEVSHQF